MSLQGQAPRFLRRCNGNGVPWVALLCTAGLACLSFMSVGEGSRVVFGWFLNLATVSGFLAWVVVLGTHLVGFCSLFFYLLASVFGFF